MKTLVYTGGKIKGYDLEIGEKLRLISKEKFECMGMTVRLHVLNSMDTHELIYVNTQELTECFEVIA